MTPEQRGQLGGYGQSLRSMGSAAFLVFSLLLNLRGEARGTLPQAVPLLVTLRAVKKGDARAFEGVYCRSVRDQAKKSGANWAQRVKDARWILSQQFGDYRLADFSYRFDGSSTLGNLTVFHKGTKALTVQVIQQSGQWKLSEFDRKCNIKIQVPLPP